MRRRIPGVLVPILLACVVVLAGGGAGAAGAAEGEPAPRVGSRTDAQLATSATVLEAETQDIGHALLLDDERRAEITHEREAARGLLAQWLAQAYVRSGSGEDVVSQVLVSGSLEEAADRIRIASVLADHHANLLRSFDRAETELDVSRLDRARMVTRLAAAQATLVGVHAEQDRRAAARGQAQRARTLKAAAALARRQEAAAARARAGARASATAASATAFSALAAPPPGTLVSSFGAGPGMPMASGSPTSQSIDAYLGFKGSPMVGQGAAFMASGQRWQVDPRLLVAIAGAESSFGQTLCGPNNAWGWACPNDPADFGSWADGIDTVTRGLRRYYLDEGRTSVTLIQQKYCPVGAANDPTGLNSHWATNVTKFLVEQGGNPAMVGPGPSGGFALPDLGGLGLGAGD